MGEVISFPSLTIRVHMGRFVNARDRQRWGDHVWLVEAIWPDRAVTLWTGASFETAREHAESFKSENGGRIVLPHGEAA